MDSARDYFEGRTLVIATKHGKERVMAPLLQTNLGVQTWVPNDFDTDLLGTFTGEIERKDDPITTLRKKCIQAMDGSNADLCVASEGSFGPHPELVFVGADDELVMLVDRKNGFEIVARELSLTTNFNQAQINSEEALRDFATKAHFPEHALILKDRNSQWSQIVKGIHQWEVLLEVYHQMAMHQLPIYVETDMRAMHNPTRMSVIEQATKKLIEKVLSLCPQCRYPGFGIVKANPGLPCQWCKAPTRSVLSYIYACAHCGFEKEELFPHQKNTEDPMYCSFCNP